MLSFRKASRCNTTRRNKEDASSGTRFVQALRSSGQYGMAAGSLAEKIGVSKFEANKLLQLHRQVYSTFWKWSDNQLDLSIINNNQQTVFGWSPQNLVSC